MEIREFRVSLSPAEAMDIIQTYVVKGSVSGTLIDNYVRKVGDLEIRVVILEKYYMRSNNRASLTVTIDNFDGETKVHVVASGSSEGVFLRFDWGAGSNFAGSVEAALKHCLI